MSSPRIAIKLDSELEDVIIKSRKQGESKAACFIRLVKDASSLSATIEKLNSQTDKNHDDTKRMLANFLEQMKRPWDQISEELTSIKNEIGNRK